MTENLTLNIERGQSGLWFVTSPEVRGLLVSERTIDEALAAVGSALRDLELAEALG